MEREASGPQAHALRPHNAAQERACQASTLESSVDPGHERLSLARVALELPAVPALGHAGREDQIHDLDGARRPRKERRLLKLSRPDLPAHPSAPPSRG